MFALRKLFVIGIAFVAVATGADPYCPEALKIAPCVCSSVDGRPNLSCSFITSEDQLETIFSADFPEPNVKELTVTAESTITSLSRNVFGEVSFEFVKLESNYLSSVGNDVFNNSLNTLRRLHVKNGPITGNSFPFDDLDKFTGLIEVEFWNNLINFYPETLSDSLVLVFVINNQIQIITNTAFMTTPALESLDLAGNQINSIHREAFFLAIHLYAITLSNNQLTELDPSTFNSLHRLKYLDLDHNQIADINSNAFNGLDDLQSLDLSYNHIEVLDRYLFDSTPSLQTLKLANNIIDYIEPGMFAACPLLGLIDLTGNQLSGFVDGTFSGLTKTSLYLAQNNIAGIRENSFGDIADSAIHLENNDFYEVSEIWARPLLEKNNQVFVTGNFIVCNCGVAWIFDNSTFQANLFGECSDGTNFANLDPDDFTSCSEIMTSVAPDAA